MGEVDQFLDEVEAELERLLKENDDLRSKLSATDGGTSAIAMPGKAPDEGAEQAPRRPEKAASPEKVEREAGRSLPSQARRCRSVRHRGDQGRHGGRGVLGSHATAGARHPQRRRGRRPRRTGGRADRRRGPHRGRAPRGGDQVQGRQARAGGPHPCPEPRLRDREQAPGDARRPRAGEASPRHRGGGPARLRAGVPQPPEELLHRAAPGARGQRRGRPAAEQRRLDGAQAAEVGLRRRSRPAGREPGPEPGQPGPDTKAGTSPRADQAAERTG